MKKYNNSITLLRSFAILSVVAAHTATIQEGCTASARLSSWFLGCLGVYGVPCFFIIAGFFFDSNKDNAMTFTKKKCQTILVPWIFCFTFLWLYVVLRKGGITIFEYLKFISGITSSAYYLTILVVFYLAFWRVRKSGAAIAMLCLVSFAWFFIQKSSLPIVLAILKGDKYLNPLYWMVYFAAGLLIHKLNISDKIVAFAKKNLFALVIMTCIMFVIHWYLKLPMNYFTAYAVFESALVILLFCGLASKLGMKENSFLIKIGEYSFSIYLLHQLFSGAIIKLTGLCENGLTVLIRPFVNILIVVGLIEAYLTIEKRLFKKQLKWIHVIIGLRD